MAEYINKSDVSGLVRIGWSGDAIVTAIINDGISSVPAIPIPDGTTNGDVVMTMFPNVECREDRLGNVFVISDAQLGYIVFRESWWNAPYKGVK